MWLAEEGIEIKGRKNLQQQEDYIMELCCQGRVREGLSKTRESQDWTGLLSLGRRMFSSKAK